jgi:hypothetical protein
MPRPWTTNVSPGLVHAAFTEPWPVLPVEVGNVSNELGPHGAQQRANRNAFAVLLAMRPMLELYQETLMLCAVFSEAGEAGSLHQSLFTCEMHARELDQPVKQFGYPFIAAAAHDCETQFVHGIHEDAMLIVHCANADGAGMIPGYESHMSLHESLMEVSAKLACLLPGIYAA